MRQNRTRTRSPLAIIIWYRSCTDIPRAGFHYRAVQLYCCTVPVQAGDLRSGSIRTEYSTTEQFRPDCTFQPRDSRLTTIFHFVTVTPRDPRFAVRSVRAQGWVSVGKGQAKPFYTRKRPVRCSDAADQPSSGRLLLSSRRAFPAT